MRVIPKNPNQKLKILYLLKILLENTDEEHHLNMSEILQKLSQQDIKAERKSIYSDIESLRLFGVDIICQKTDVFGYYIGKRDFELPELKLLVDSVQASKFITKKKSNDLIKKIEGLTDKYSARELQRQVYTSDRVKALNEKIYYNVDKLHDAIINGKQIAFKYYVYNTDKKKQLRNEGDDYIISPYSLAVSDENYYVISHYPKYEGLSHFRVDRMTDIRILDIKANDIKLITDENFNIGEYSRKLFNMFSGETQIVQLKCDNKLIDSIIDRFGEDVSIRKLNNNKFIVTTKINISPTFFAWVFTFEDKMEIISPLTVVNQFKQSLEKVGKLYC